MDWMGQEMLGIRWIQKTHARTDGWGIKRVRYELKNIPLGGV
jgi:hypothetical protein